MQAKKAIVIFLGLGLLGGSIYWLYREKKKAQPKAPTTEPEEKAEQEKAKAENQSAPTTTADTKPPVKKPAKKIISTVPNAAPLNKPQPVSADILLQRNGEKAIYNKLLIAKNTSAGIYDTTNKKVSTTNAGEQLGKAYKAERTSAGNWIIKYQDWGGNYRWIASSSVNVL